MKPRVHFRHWQRAAAADCAQSGGQFYFAYALAPPRWKTLLSYVTGWVTVLTWIAAPTLLSYLASSTLIDLIAFLQPSYSPQPWHGLLISWAVLVMGVTCNTLLGALMPLIELSFLILHIIGFFAFLITLANLGPPGDARQVFTQFNNEGGWPNVGLAFLVGLQGAAGSFTGMRSQDEVFFYKINTGHRWRLINTRTCLKWPVHAASLTIHPSWLRKYIIRMWPWQGRSI